MTQSVESQLADGRALLADDLVAVETILASFITGKRHCADNAEVSLLAEWMEQFLAGGKRFRPLMCCTGWRTAGGQGTIPEAVASVAASLELFHTFALIHDDVMDGSATRRGRPTVHRHIAGLHSDHRDPNQFGTSAAILVGDLAFGWSYDLLDACALHPAQSDTVRQLLVDMRTETITGQYLDLLSTGRPVQATATALRIARFKTAKYTVERPLQAGVVLAGGDETVLGVCSDYGVALGEAFQLRDELLGVFGSPDSTGKSTLDDLSDGKPTVLMAIAYQRASASQRGRLDTLIGDGALDERDAIEVRDILIATGAAAAVEEMITTRYQRALEAVDSAALQPIGMTLLRQLANDAIERLQ
jgi:geranylgeranyl diphosphate synthase type I